MVLYISPRFATAQVLKIILRLSELNYPATFFSYPMTKSEEKYYSDALADLPRPWTESLPTCSVSPWPYMEANAARVRETPSQRRHLQHSVTCPRTPAGISCTL